MKICFITGTIFNLGGVQRVLSVLASELSKNYEVDILCTNDKYIINRQLYNLNSNVNIKINTQLVHEKFINKFICKVFKRINKLTNIFNKKSMISILTYIYYPDRIQEKFVNYLNAEEYDIVVGVEGRYSVLLGILADKLNCKVIGWQHNSYDAYLNNKNRYYWNQDQLFKQYLPNLHKCIVLTKEDKNIYKQKLGVNCEVIYNPLSFYSNEKSKCENKSIIFVGRLSEQQKGLDLVIQAFNLVHNEKKDWILKIVGDGPDRDKLIEHINRYNLIDNVILVGKSDNVKKHYLDASIFISSSRWEGFGLVITEAMECGLPVISFANSGPKEIIDNNGVNGILVPCYDVNKLAYNIIELINNKEKRKKISEQSIIRAQCFKIEKLLLQWERLFY